MKKWKHQNFIGSDMNPECEFILKVLQAADCAISPDSLFSFCKDKGFSHRTCQQAVWHMAAEKFIEFTIDWKLKAL